jgi:hypothetical protein
MFLYTSDGGPDEAGYKRTMSFMTKDIDNIIFETNDCLKHKVHDYRYSRAFAKRQSVPL